MEENESNFTYISALLVTHIGHANVIYPIDYTMFILYYAAVLPGNFIKVKTSAFLTFTSSHHKMTSYIKHEMQQHRCIDNNISRNPLSPSFTYADT